MDDAQKQRTIWLSYIADKKMSEKLLKTHQFFMLLFNTLQCQNYTNKAENVIFILVALPEQAAQEKEKLTFRRSKKEFELRIMLDYSQMMCIEDTQEMTDFLSNIFLVAIEKWLCNRKDFEGKLFYADLKNVFLAQKNA